MEVCDVDFNDILQQAELLTAEIESSSELPRVQRNLRQVLEAGQVLLEKTKRDGHSIDAETRAAVFLGTKGVDVTKLSDKLDPLYITPMNVESHETLSEVDVDDFLKNERMSAMCAVVETSSASILQEIQDKIASRLEEEWKHEREEILASLSGSLKTLDFDKKMYDYKPEPISVLSSTEITYAHEISLYNAASINSHPKGNLMERLQLAAKNSGDRNLQELWECLMALTVALPNDSPSDDLMHRRASESFINAIVSRGKKYLEQSHYTRLQNDVWSHLEEARLGGVPGALQLIKSFINLKGLNAMTGLDIGAGDVGPIWLIVYLLLRCGKSNEACIYMRDSVCNSDFSKCLEEYHKSGCSRLPLELEGKIRLEYRRTLKNTTRDPYKKAVYCILGGCDVEDDHNEVVGRLDDYLWLKLSVIRHNKDHKYTTDVLSFDGLQTLIYEKFGETYFEAFKQPHVYTQALLLTGQFEAAVEFMSRVNGMLSHAVHVAIALNEFNLLLRTDTRAPMLHRQDSDPPGLRSLNYSRLVVNFARSLEGCNAKDALNYLYLLRDIKERSGEDLFTLYVSDLVLDSRDFDLFGVMNTDGCRTPGLLEQMGIHIQHIVQRCATESESRGLLEDAIVLYDLAGDLDETLRILCRVLSQNVGKNPLPDSPRQRVQQLAIAYAERFQKCPPKLRDQSSVATFYMLVDFMTFFDTVFSKQLDVALSIIQRLKVIPMDRSEVEKCKTDFHTFSDEIRVNVPSLIVATMETIHLKYQTIKSSRKSIFGASELAKSESFLKDLKTKAQAIVTYCGMIPYFMTGEVYTKVMQIEVQMN